MWIAIQNAVGARQGVGGGPGPDPFTGFLDTPYGSGAVTAFSVRRLSSSTNEVLRVIRDTNGGVGHHDLIDVTFDASNNISLDSPVSNPSSSSAATNLGQFFGNPAYGNPDSLPITSITGAVHTWYDQVGTNHAVQTDYVRQPRIYSGTLFAGALIVTGVRLRLGLANAFTNLELSAALTDSDLDIFTVSNVISSPTGLCAFLSSDPNDVLLISQNGDSSNHTARMGTPSFYLQGNSFTGTTRGELYTALGGDGQTIIDAFNVDVSDAIYTRLGWPDVGVPAWEMQEVIFYNTDKTGSRQQIEENFNEYYQVTNLPYYTSGFLADYSGAAAAYSVRKLSNTAIKALRVRRAVAPFDELDIGFTPAGDLDEQAIVDFGGSDVLVVSRWYDQSGKSNHAVQITPGLQPQIYNGTAVITENGKPGLSFNFDILNISSQISFTGSTHIQSVAQYRINRFLYGGPTGHFLQVEGPPATGTMSYRGFGVDVFGIPTYNADEQSTQTVARDVSDDCRIYYNGTLLDTELNRTATTYLDRIGDGNGSTAGSYNGIFQELIAWQVDQTSNRTAIETNINDYYKIIINPDAATSGFLFDYPNAAAAYSVRQLNNNAEYCMQVERSDGRTLNVGFVAGELDTQAIIDFAGASSATVSKWFDQTGNQNHSVQDISVKQPEIYNGVSVFTDNGKPAVRFTDPGLDSNRDTLNWVYNVDTQLFSWSCVAGFNPSGATRTIFHRDNTGAGNYLRVNTNGYTIVKPNDFDNLNGSTFDGTQKLNTVIRSSATTVTSYQDGSQTGTISTLDASNIVWGNTDAGITGTGVLSFNAQEIILWDVDKNAAGQRPAIELNIMTYYGIP